VYIALESLESLYRSNGIFHTLFQLKENTTCLLSDVMEEAESAWQSILKRTTIALLHQALNNTKVKDIEL
jgi:DNA-binding IscR family transcriptional regulator